ncbi:MAG: EVE domain-containing protein [Deltaproteobacteria bacterium]|nr:EVE domain-containing protein [Deltaproteobacteria bacterium]
MTPRFWLMKTEPTTYSIEDLQRDGVTSWEGVRNYQVRNLMRDEMRRGDKVLIYHSNAKPPGVVGVAEVVREAYPDHHALDPSSHYYAQKATADKNPWVMVDVAFVAQLPRLVSLDELKAAPQLEGMWVLRRGSRLSVQPVDEAHFSAVLALADQG